MKLEDEEEGVVAAGDMTTEAAATKLAYLFGRSPATWTRGGRVGVSLRGEISHPRRLPAAVLRGAALQVLGLHEDPTKGRPSPPPAPAAPDASEPPPRDAKQRRRDIALGAALGVGLALVLAREAVGVFFPAGRHRRGADASCGPFFEAPRYKSSGFTWMGDSERTAPAVSRCASPRMLKPFFSSSLSSSLTSSAASGSNEDRRLTGKECGSGDACSAVVGGAPKNHMRSTREAIPGGCACRSKTSGITTERVLHKS